MSNITLKAARVNAGIKQSEAAKAIGVSRSTIARYEKDPGAMTCSNFYKLCALYGVKGDLIFCPNVD